MAKELTIFSKKRGGREEGKKGKDSLRSPPEDKSAPRGEGDPPMESADTVAIATWKGTERGRETGKVVNKMGVWIVIRIWEGKG